MRSRRWLAGLAGLAVTGLLAPLPAVNAAVAAHPAVSERRAFSIVSVPAALSRSSLPSLAKPKTAPARAVRTTTSTVISAAAKPPSSTAAMPSGDQPGWRRIFADDFTGSTLSRSWFRYGGVPSGSWGGRYATSHVSVGGGLLQIEGSRDPASGRVWTTGGLSNRHAVARTYGKYLVRFRVDQGKGMPYAILLWPSDNTSAHEIDFAEDNGSDRSLTTASVHRVVAGKRLVERREVAADFSQWHTAGVEWLPGKITYTLDGRVWGSATGSVVPDVPMSLAIQMQTWACGHTWEICPGAYTPASTRLQVDWVVGYAPV